MSLTDDEIKYIKDELDKSVRPMYFYDDDPDGLTSFLLFYRYKKEGRGIIVKSTPELKANFARKIEEYNPDTIFILDKPLVSQDFVDACKGKKIIWLDHHGPQNINGVKYFNPRLHNDNDNRPTSYWCYRIVEQGLWIAMCGIVGDWALPDDVTIKFKERYPKYLNEDINKPQDALFNSKIGEVSRIFSFLLKGKTNDVKKNIKVLSRIESLDELYEHNTSQSKFLYKAYKKIEEEYHKLLSSINTKDKNIILYTYKDAKISFTSDISNELLYKYPNKLIIIGREKDDEMKVSFRSSKLILPPLIEKALENIEGYGGGHDHACGGSIKIKDFDRFIDQLKEQIK